MNENIKIFELPSNLTDKYQELRPSILKRLQEFADVPKKEYFYEMCYCICTPQSKAAHAWIVQQKLQELDFYNKPFDPSNLLRNPNHYIRFHNQKAERLFSVRIKYKETIQMLESDMDIQEKRKWLVRNITGYGWKEASHFMRNIGYRGLAILDRHILKHMMQCGVFDEIPKVANEKQYLQVEEMFKKFADEVKIDMDELDILFWSYESGEILK